MAKKYLDLTGLQSYHNKTIEYIDNKSYSTDYEYTDGLVFTFVTDHYIVGDNSDTYGNGYTGTATKIVVPKFYDDGMHGVAKVTEIGQRAFGYKTSITAVKLPDTITSIGSKAFNHCDALSQIMLSEGLTTIGSSAFSEQSNGIKTIVIPASVTSIGRQAFDCSNALKTVVVLSINPPSLGDLVFRSTVESISVPYGSLNAYKTATNWVTYAAVIYPIPEGKWIMEEMPKQVTYTATLPSASWTGTSAPYSKAVTVSGILSTDIPDIDLDLSSVAYANIAAMQTDWAKVYRAATSANTITFYATEKPSADIKLKIKVVR